MATDNNKMQQFRLIYIVFLKTDKGGNMHQLVQKATDEEIMDSEGVTLRILNDNCGQKMTAFTMGLMGKHT